MGYNEKESLQKNITDINHNLLQPPTQPIQYALTIYPIIPYERELQSNWWGWEKGCRYDGQICMQNTRKQSAIYANKQVVFARNFCAGF